MNRFLKSVLVTTTVAATTLVPIIEASAGERWRQHRPRHPEQHHREQAKDDLLAAGILGLVIGGLVVGAISAAESEPDYVVDDYPDVDYFPPAPGKRYPRPQVVYADQDAYGGLEPWTREWFDYCRNRYRSFNDRTGTFRGYDGQDHFCVAN